jgi:membrane protease YdiL (CAAX protease family)
MEATKEKGTRRALAAILGMYAVCTLVRYVEFLFIRTERSFLEDNTLNKLFIIAALAVFLAARRWKWAEIGIAAGGAARGIGLGLALGLGTFAAAYAAEFAICAARGLAPSFEIYYSGFSPGGEAVKRTAPAFFFLCFAVNAINVWAEEGLFRGLFARLGRDRWGFAASNALQALLFGLWHIAMVAAKVADGSMGPGAAAASGAVYVALSALLGLKWGLCAGMSGALWMGMADHFVNNALANVLHVSAGGVVDAMQVPRIAIAQLASLAIVVAAYLLKRKRAVAAG